MRTRLEFKRRNVRAKLISQSNLPSAVAREAWAEAHPDYEAACEAEAQAIEDDEYFRSNRNAAETIVDVWRTECSNERAGSSFR